MKLNKNKNLANITDCIVVLLVVVPMSFIIYGIYQSVLFSLGSSCAILDFMHYSISCACMILLSSISIYSIVCFWKNV